MQREVGTEPDYVILIKNNLQDPTTSNPSASAGKYFVFGEGPIKEKLIERGVQFDQKQMFLMANNHNFDEETEVVDEELQSFAIEKAKLIQQFEKEYLHKLLEETGGNISRAATIAKKERRAFSRLMQKHGLDRKTYV